MARLQTLGSLCAFYNSDLDSILVPCIFCDRFLDGKDKRAFDGKSLSLVWRSGIPYAVCSPCCVERAFEDCCKNVIVTLEGDGVEKLCMRPLCEVPVRCKYCLKPLSAGEKIRCVEKRQPFGLIRGRWRNVCGNCED
ncbi:E6 [Canis familiaris papillomavirus 17]|uniref:Protein E6 n=1 Tax=Canis familiaris papillomavirus 17 TaxID=1778550 RepID=A0A0U4K543_9PAPI|nr:E6 [Canis familiaris papillomavirus 17]